MKSFHMSSKYSVTILSIFAIFGTLMNGSNAQDEQRIILFGVRDFLVELQGIIATGNNSVSDTFTLCVTENKSKNLEQYVNTIDRNSKRQRKNSSDTLSISKDASVTVHKDDYSSGWSLPEFDKIKGCAKTTYDENIEESLDSKFLLEDGFTYKQKFFHAFWTYKNSLLNDRKIDVTPKNIPFLDEFFKKIKSNAVFGTLDRMAIEELQREEEQKPQAMSIDSLPDEGTSATPRPAVTFNREEDESQDEGDNTNSDEGDNTNSDEEDKILGTPLDLLSSTPPPAWQIGVLLLEDFLHKLSRIFNYDHGKLGYVFSLCISMIQIDKDSDNPQSLMTYNWNVDHDQAETISNEIGNCSNQAFITTYFDVLLRKVKEKRHSVFDLQKIYDMWIVFDKNLFIYNLTHYYPSTISMKRNVFTMAIHNEAEGFPSMGDVSKYNTLYKTLSAY